MPNLANLNNYLAQIGPLSGIIYTLITLDYIDWKEKNQNKNERNV